MQIQVSTDHNVEGREAFIEHVKSVVEDRVGRFHDRVTRVEVHATDENGAKTSADDKRCVMEARPQGHQAVAVTHHAGTVHDAVAGAAHKLERLLETTFGKVDGARHNPARGAI
jgi:ribosome-associated translation inhibitor RaiA